jgi:GT2 family glycosyltransferase
MRWCAGIVNHGSYDDLERCLAALGDQTLRPEAIAVYDTGEDPARFESIRRAHPDVAFERGPNRGYAGGSNRVIDQLIEIAAPFDFTLLLNPDVEPDPDYASRLIDEMTRRSAVAIATGKLLRPDRSTLDSAGITMPPNRRPRDRGSDTRDVGQFESIEEVDGASGAAMMLRMKAAAELVVEGELFDERFFAYHEDTDLCWRARLYGWRILYVPEAIGLHRRGWQRSRRGEVPIEIRRHSFKNHYLQIVKNETRGGFVRHLPWLLGWEILRLGFVLVRERDLIPAYRDAWNLLPDARRKRRHIQARARRGRPRGAR